MSNGEYEQAVSDESQEGTSLSARQVQKDESRPKKITSRVLGGLTMFSVFSASVYMGHAVVCVMVALIEVLLFRELVRVRYSKFFFQIQDTIPLFRTTQWLWFTVAIFYTYGDFLSDVIQSNSKMHYLLPYVQYLPTVSLFLYSGTLILTISTLQREQIKFQINQLCWTILVILVTVGQLKGIMHNIFNGLIWYVLPCCLVFVNDIMAYVSGMLWGRKFIQRPLIIFSPNKTWEGFIGAIVFTMITAWYLSRFLAQFSWMTCPTNRFTLFPTELKCRMDPTFLPAQVRVPSQIFELLPRWLVKIIPNVVHICKDSENRLDPCVSGNASQTLHHFELTLTNYYPIQAHALWLGLFASLVAPFGGFLASAFKRAYGLKDFASIIPGHGGVMDRMDCQFLMALCTWVHYNTFVKLASVSVPKLVYMYSMLSDQDKLEFLEAITHLRQDGSTSTAEFPYIR